MARFRQHESLIRQQYARAEGTLAPPQNVLERATRRFLIDNLLRALDWDPDDPTQMAEEARAQGTGKDWLYFDYLGKNRETDTPVLLFEAKGFDLPTPRQPRGGPLSSQDMAVLIARDIDAVKKGGDDQNLAVTAEWGGFLRDLYGYIGSLDSLGRSTLRRAAITAGQWLIVFRDPVATFGTQDPSNTEHIRCFASTEELVERHAEVYGLLHRERLVDTLPRTLTAPDALRMIPAARMGTDVFRAVLVATSSVSGALRRRYPTRSVYPAIVIDTAGRWFAIVDYSHMIEEPKSSERIENFLLQLTAHGERFEQELARRCGRALTPTPIEQFPGFPPTLLDKEFRSGIFAPIAGSTAERQGEGADITRNLVVHSGERDAGSEFIVVTGTAWFYKADRPQGPECPFHYWKDARDAGAAGAAPLSEYVVNSFTEDGQQRHCAHAHLVALRESRCHLRALETHLCCRTCLYFNDCWSVDWRRMPCP